MSAEAKPSSAHLTELRSLLADVYTPEGVEVWLAHAAKQGWTLEEQLQRAEALATGGDRMSGDERDFVAHLTELRALAEWLVTLDDPEDVIGREERRSVTLTQIIDRARLALGGSA